MNWRRALQTAPVVFAILVAADYALARDEFEPSKPSYWINVASASVAIPVLLEAALTSWRWLRRL